LAWVAADVGPFGFRTSTEDDVAGKEALVFASLSICSDGVLRWRRLRVVVLNRLNAGRIVNSDAAFGVLLESAA